MSLGLVVAFGGLGLFGGFLLVGLALVMGSFMGEICFLLAIAWAKLRKKDFEIIELNPYNFSNTSMFVLPKRIVREI